MNLKTIADHIVDAVLDGGLGPDYREAIVSNVLDELEPVKQAFAKQNHEICQILGKALGYPKFADDQKNFPGATGEDVCVGEHTAETIAAEAANKLAFYSHNQPLRANVEGDELVIRVSVDTLADKIQKKAIEYWNSVASQIESSFVVVNDSVHFALELAEAMNTELSGKTAIEVMVENCVADLMERGATSFERKR